jgi:cob(I)alamin adenosyltransferase
MKFGKVHVYTGNGKGKTSCAIGLSIRAAGRDYKVYFIQFLKYKKSGEEEILSQIKNITFKKFGFKEFIKNNQILKEHIKIIEKGKKYLKEILNKEKIDILILDEINLLNYYNLISIQEIKEIINICKQKKVELILTGRKASKKIFKLADLVTEMKEIKHYFKTTNARKGIEF